MNDLTWRCHICDEERPDALISVRTFDVSKEKGLPSGSIQQNVRYCNDRDACVKGAREFPIPDALRRGRRKP